MFGSSKDLSVEFYRSTGSVEVLPSGLTSLTDPVETASRYDSRLRFFCCFCAAAISAIKPVLDESVGSEAAGCCSVKSIEARVEFEPWPERLPAPFLPSAKLESFLASIQSSLVTHYGGYCFCLLTCWRPVLKLNCCPLHPYSTRLSVRLPSKS